MSEYREPVMATKTDYVQVHHEDITPADAGLFGTSVSFTGSNAATWMDAITQIVPLLSCNEEYARFDQDPDNLKRWKYPPRPSHMHPKSESAAVGDSDGNITPKVPPRPSHIHPKSESAAVGDSDGNITPKVEAAPAHGLDGIHDLPRELREKIWLATEEPRIVGADVLLLNNEAIKSHRAVIVIATSGYGTTLGPFHHLIRNPRWDDIKLYGLCPEAHDLAVREYGQPAVNSVPFRSAVDELLVEVSLDRQLDYDLGAAERNRRGLYAGCFSGFCYRTKELEGFFDRRWDVETGAFIDWEEDEWPPCAICMANEQALGDSSVAAFVATDEEFARPNPGPPWLGDNPILMHRTFKPAPADLLNRFRKVIFRMRRNHRHGDMTVSELWEGPDYIQQAYQALGGVLPKALPRLEALTLRVEPMRDFTSDELKTDYDVESHHLFDGRRVYFLDGLTTAGNMRHDVGCNGVLPCDCQLLPFQHLQRLDVQVNTKKMFYFWEEGGRRPYLECFTDRPRLDSLFVCPKGLAPLLSNGTRDPSSDISSERRFLLLEGRPGRTFMDPRGFRRYYFTRQRDERRSHARLLAILDRPDSPEPI